MPAQQRSRKRGEFLFHPFVLFRPWMDGVMPTHIGEDSLLNQLHHRLISAANTLTDTRLNNISPVIWAFLSQLSRQKGSMD